MKLFRKLTTMLCVLALLLSLAPAAFAEEEEIVEEEPVIEATEIVENKTEEVNAGKSGEIKYEGNQHVNENVTVEIKPKADGAADSTITVENGILINDGTVSAEAKATKAHKDCGAEVHADDGIINNGTISVTGKGGAANIKADAAVTTDGDLLNIGTITATGGDATISVAGKLENYDTILITADGEANLDVGAGSENWGGIIVNGAEVNIDEELKNFSTIQVGDETYYGLYYWDEADDDYTYETAFDSYKEGLAGEGKSIVLRDSALTTRDGYTFGGWRFDGADYAGGATVSYDLNESKVIEAIWNKILAAATGGGGGEEVTVEKSKEKIVKYMDGYKVLDADRKEMKMETEYFNVAKTSYGRLIVVFTWQQMAEMEEGEHLFYIVSPDNVETEYTLTIW